MDGGTAERRHLREGARAAALWPFRTLGRLTRDGWLFAALALVCALLSLRAHELSNLPLLIGLALLSLLLTALAVGAVALRGVKFTRQGAERTFAGEPLTFTLSVANAGRLPLAGLTLTERLGPAAPRAAAFRGREEGGRPRSAPSGEAFVTALTARGEDRVRYPLLIRSRGVYEFEATRVSTVFPFGLWRSQVERTLAGRLVVYPRLADLDTEYFKELEMALTRVRRHRAVREEHEFRGLREYRQGDHPKWIHWRTSARLCKPFVKEFEQPQSKRVLLFLDTNLRGLGPQRLAAFELAISFVATAARELARRGCEVSFGTWQPDGWRTVTVSRERRNLETLLELLAGLRPAPGRSLSEAAPLVPRRVLAHAFVLALVLGSVREQAELDWLHAPHNEAQVLQVRSEAFRRLFRPVQAAMGGVVQREEDLLELMGVEPADSGAEEEAEVSA